jgi:cysteinyl-tRNA synthetase
LSDLTDMGYTGREIRYWLISGHYRKPITFSKERLEDTKRSLKRLDSCINSLIHLQSDGSPFPELDQLLYDIKQGFVNAMDDDLNISAALASIFKNVKKVNILILENRLDTNDASKILDAFRNLDAVLKIFDFEDAHDDPEVQRLIKERERARLEKNWDLADKLRDQLKARGITIKDQKLVSNP